MLIWLDKKITYLNVKKVIKKPLSLFCSRLKGFFEF